MGVDANGDPDRYQRGVYDGIQIEWMSLTSIWVVSQKL